MSHWQQFALREDPWSAIPFGAAGLSVDAKVGLVCIACVVVVYLLKGF